MWLLTEVKCPTAWDIFNIHMMLLFNCLIPVDTTKFGVAKLTLLTVSSYEKNTYTSCSAGIRNQHPPLHNRPSGCATGLLWKWPYCADKAIKCAVAICIYGEARGEVEKQEVTQGEELKQEVKEKKRKEESIWQGQK